MAEILFVDDEQPILRALKRTFRGFEGWTYHFADSPLEALKVLAEHNIAVIVSDHRMPQMDGAEFLSRVKQKRPSTVRIMLTGQANLDAVQHAVNSGEIYRFVLKPWDDDELKQLLRNAVEYHNFKVHTEKLADAAQCDNVELMTKAEELDLTVQKRTKQLSDALFTAKAANDRLQTTLHQSTRAMALLIQTARPDIGSHSKRVAEHALAIGATMDLDNQEIEALEIASLLHDNGKLGFPAFLIEKNKNDYSTQEIEIYRSHPVVGSQNLEQIPEYDNVCQIIRCHHERYNGKGFPIGLRSGDITLQAYIVGIADELDHLLTRPNLKADFVFQHAFQTIADGADDEFPGKLTQVVLDYMESNCRETDDENMMAIGLSDVATNMTLARDIYSMSGSLLLAAGSCLTPHNIKLIRSISKVDPVAGKIYVSRKPRLVTRQ